MSHQILILCDKPASAQIIATALSAAAGEDSGELTQRKQGDLAVHEFYAYCDLVKVLVLCLLDVDDFPFAFHGRWGLGRRTSVYALIGVGCQSGGRGHHVVLVVVPLDGGVRGGGQRW